MAVIPPRKSEQELRDMSKDELVEYAQDRQEEAYACWEAMMGDDL